MCCQQCFMASFGCLLSKKQAPSIDIHVMSIHNCRISPLRACADNPLHTGLSRLISFQQLCTKHKYTCDAHVHGCCTLSYRACLNKCTYACCRLTLIALLMYCFQPISNGDLSSPASCQSAQPPGNTHHFPVRYTRTICCTLRSMLQDICKGLKALHSQYQLFWSCMEVGCASQHHISIA